MKMDTYEKIIIPIAIAALLGVTALLFRINEQNARQSAALDGIVESVRVLRDQVYDNRSDIRELRELHLGGGD